MALTLLRSPLRLAGVLGLSCYLLLHTEKPVVSEANKETPVLMCHGDCDQASHGRAAGGGGALNSWSKFWTCMNRPCVRGLQYASSSGSLCAQGGAFPEGEPWEPEIGRLVWRSSCCSSCRGHPPTTCLPVHPPSLPPIPCPPTRPPIPCPPSSQVVAYEFGAESAKWLQEAGVAAEFKTYKWMGERGGALGTLCRASSLFVCAPCGPLARGAGARVWSLTVSRVGSLHSIAASALGCCFRRSERWAGAGWDGLGWVVGCAAAASFLDVG